MLILYQVSNEHSRIGSLSLDSPLRHHHLAEVSKAEWDGVGLGAVTAPLQVVGGGKFTSPTFVPFP